MTKSKGLPSVTELQVEQAINLCLLLADEIQAGGSRRPRITPKWKQEALLLLGKDGRDYEEARAIIRWATSDSFWRGNILSMPKLRKQYDQLRLKIPKESLTMGHYREQNLERIQAWQRQALDRLNDRLTGKPDKKG